MYYKSALDSGTLDITISCLPGPWPGGKLLVPGRVWGPNRHEILSSILVLFHHLCSQKNGVYHPFGIGYAFPGNVQRCPEIG